MSALKRGLARFGTEEPVDLPPVLHGGPFEQVQADVGSFWVLASDEVMRPYIAERGQWEEATAELLRSLIRPGCRFLDVGANFGYFTMFAHHLVGDVHVDAVEPHPVLCDLLRANLWLNDCHAQVWNVALGNQRMLIPMSSPPMNPGDSRVGASATGAELVVPILSADDLFVGRSFDVVKIDVQGWEPDVIVGMERIVRDSPGIVLVVEFFPTALRERGLEPEEVIERYRRLGCHIAVHDDWGLGNCELDDVVAHCDSGGRDGQVNLVLRRG
jgi:FkbM family methyltransferase